MKVNKDIRNLLMSQSEFVVTSKRTGMYLGVEYKYPPVTDSEYEQLRMDLVKALDNKLWIREKLSKLFK